MTPAHILRLTSWPDRWTQSRSAWQTRPRLPAPHHQSTLSSHRLHAPPGSSPHPDPGRRLNGGTGSAADGNFRLTLLKYTEVDSSDKQLVSHSNLEALNSPVASRKKYCESVFIVLQVCYQAIGTSVSSPNEGLACLGSAAEPGTSCKQVYCT